MNIQQIERLREAAKENGEDCAQYLSDAMVAAEFVEFDRGGDGSSS